MSNDLLTSKDKSVYLDTSFILYSTSDSVDHNEYVRNEASQYLWLLFQYKDENCYISNIVISELFHAVERSGFQVFIDKKIIKELSIDNVVWNSYSKEKRNEKRIEYSSKIWFNIKEIKKWRDKEFLEDYRLLVINEFNNIVDSLPPTIKVLSTLDNNTMIKKFLATKTKYYMLDSNDTNHYLLCKEHNINWIITCDKDFSQIDDKEIEIELIDIKFKNYK